MGLNIDSIIIVVFSVLIVFIKIYLIIIRYLLCNGYCVWYWNINNKIVFVFNKFISLYFCVGDMYIKDDYFVVW